MAEEVATFALKIDADGDPAAEAAEELEKFRKAIDKSKGALENYQKSLRLLRGSSDEVKDAKAKLKAAIELERGKMSQANLGILKLGGSYDKLTKAAKKNTHETDAGRKAIAAVGGPAKGLLEKFDGMKEALPALASGWGALAAAVAVGVAGIAIATAAIGALTAKFTAWLATTADANRNLALNREAFSGSAKNAQAWGHIIDWAAEKTALTTAQLNELTNGIEKSARGSRITGAAMVNTFHAMAAAAGAGRQDVADFFKEIVERGKLTGRTYIAFPDLQRFRNAGIKIQDVYRALGISAKQARAGVIISSSQMAAALAKLSENRFAELNKKKMLSLGSQWDRFKDNLMRFTNDLAGQGGALEPLLGALKQVADLFDLSTQSGQEMKAAVTKYGKEIATAIVAHLPDIKAFVAEVIHLAGVFIDAAAAVVQWAQSANGATTIKAILVAIGVTVGVLAVAFGTLAAIVAAPFVILAAAIYGVMKAVDWIKGIKWSEIGHDIVEGIKSGLAAAWDSLKGAVASMGHNIKKAFEDALHIGSPSKDFARYGKFSAQGYAQGIDRSTPIVRTATVAMAAEAKGGAAAAGARVGGVSASGGGSRSITVENHFIIGAGANAADVKQELSSHSFLSAFEQSIKVIMQTQGIPVGTPATSGG